MIQQWWKDAKFGMFIHWGIYSVPAGEYGGVKTDNIAEWIMHDLRIPIAEYEKFARYMEALVAYHKFYGGRD